jgi:hypothetical protein
MPNIETNTNAIEMTNFQFNTSTNPFAYIRSENDIDIFISNIMATITDYPNEEGVIRNSLRLLWVVTAYLFYSVDGRDLSVDSILKIIKSTCDSPEIAGEKTVFEAMFTNDTPASVLDNYDHFKLRVFGTDSNFYKEAVAESINLLKAISPEQLIVGMKNDERPTQAVFEYENIKYELWIHFSAEFGVYNLTRPGDESVLASLYLPSAILEDENKDICNVFLGVPKLDYKKILPLKAADIVRLIKKDQKSLQKDTNQSLNLFGKLLKDNEVELFYKPYVDYPIALHEAGHAVAGYQFGVICYGATIDGIEDDYLGRVFFKSLDDLDAANSAIIYYSGAIAEQMSGFGMTYGFRKDFKNAVTTIKNAVRSKISANDAAQTYKYIPAMELGLSKFENPYVVHETTRQCIDCYNQALRLIAENKKMVIALAEELMNKRTMSGEAVRSFLDTFKESLEK